MLRHQYESRAKQVNEKIHSLASSLHNKMFFDGHDSTQSEHVHKNAVVDDNSIRLLAYQLYCKKGGSDVDNWLAAESFLKNTAHVSFNFEN